jgi:molecular chaperone GrpE
MVEEPREEAAAAEQSAAEQRAAEQSAAEPVEQDLDALLADVKRERDEYLELAQRSKADFENYRKRMAAESAAAVARGRVEVAEALIGVIDNLERALDAAGADADGPLAEGIRLTHRDLIAVLDRAGVEAYDPSGEAFDPNWHEALQTRAADGVEPGHVLEVVQKGYRQDSRPVRPARVVVSE